MNSKIDIGHLSSALQTAGFRFLPLKERSLLRLLYCRGATQGELAGALGVSRGAVRRMLRRALLRATDPENLAILRCWRWLADEERRLARLHRFLGISLSEIARNRLIAPAGFNGSPPDPASFGQLRGMMRNIQRKARRHDRRTSTGLDHEGSTQARQEEGDDCASVSAG